MTVYSMDRYPTNAELICAARDLGYLNDDYLILDPTFGLGVFWKAWQPQHFFSSDLDPTKAGSVGEAADFTNLPWEDDSFDAVVFDPPYKLNGTPSGTDERYGVHLPTRWQDRMRLCRDGITECLRVLKPRGFLLVKCMDQVVSGAKVFQTDNFTHHAQSMGAVKVDQLHMQVNPRPQPAGRRQVHSQGNYSTLLVFKKMKEK